MPRSTAPDTYAAIRAPMNPPTSVLANSGAACIQATLPVDAITRIAIGTMPRPARKKPPYVDATNGMPPDRIAGRRGAERAAMRCWMTGPAAKKRQCRQHHPRHGAAKGLQGRERQQAGTDQAAGGTRHRNRCQSPGAPPIPRLA
ncbi:MAG: hypothetical protein KIT47_07365 [Rhodoferax sp.]|nr:hypothetical protein [Rhodoferax sp.]